MPVTGIKLLFIHKYFPVLNVSCLFRDFNWVRAGNCVYSSVEIVSEMLKLEVTFCVCEK